MAIRTKEERSTVANKTNGRSNQDKPNDNNVGGGSAEKKKKQQQQQSTAAATISATAKTLLFNNSNNNNGANAENLVLAEEHLPPLFLTLVVLVCSGFLAVLAIRDFGTTGRNILGSWDRAMLAFTKSTDWYDDSRGWKSQMGGFSAVKDRSTDRNNMGGFFVRKCMGAAALAVHLQKLVPLLAQLAPRLRWNRGHYLPLLQASIWVNLLLTGFLFSYYDDFETASALELPFVSMVLLMAEAVVMSYYVYKLKTELRNRPKPKVVAIAMTQGKTPASVPSRIVARTVAIVSTLIGIHALRDLVWTGRVLPLVPGDDLYLEWTNAFYHSPPADSPEYRDHGLEAPFYVGDKYACQYVAIHLLCACAYKFVGAFLIKYGNDGCGLDQSQMIWKVQAAGNACLLFTVRVFTPAAKTASIDFRWHLMLLAYETFILALYGYF